MTTSLSNITVKDGQNTLVVKANDITINGSSILATNNFVTLDTNQEITGVKSITRGTDTVFIQFKNTGMDRTVNPSTANYTHCKFLDKNALVLSDIYLRDTSTEREIRFLVYDKNGNNKGMLNIGCDSNDNGYTTAITPAVTDNSTKIATTAWVKTAGNGIVHTSGNETITGTKTFSENTIHSMDAIRKSSTITRGTAPSSTQYTSWLIRDKNNAQIGNFYVTQTTSNEIQASMIATNLNSSDVAYDAAIRVIAKRDGTVYTYAPTPATSDNSTQIATTAFVKAQGYLTSHQSLSNYVTLNGDQTISGTKAFSSAVQFANNILNNIGDDVKVGDGNVGGCLVIQGTNNATGIQLRPQDGTTGNNRKIYLNNDYISLDVTPAVSDNSTKIATTAYCNNKHQVVSALPASPDANVFYYIPA